MTLWMNVDKPSRTCTVHQEGCAMAKSRAETPSKGVGKLKEDGGWLSFESREAAHNHVFKNWNELYIIDHC
jgi:hypothetical protein